MLVMIYTLIIIMNEYYYQKNEQSITSGIDAKVIIEIIKMILDENETEMW